MAVDLQAAVRQALDSAGPLAKSVDGFTSRPGQSVMALEIARIMQEGGLLVVEAGTGVGKTFAYLIPALLSGERVLLSTATKTLQDQLFGRDIPRLMAALGIPARVALLKGRSSYLCLHRMGLARHRGDDWAPASLADLALVEGWSARTVRGDMAEIAQLNERSPILPWVTSTRDNCLGGECPQVKECHVNRARREAMAADVVVINHHLFFADLNVRESGVAELLPGVRCVVFDEAHQLNEIGVQFLGRQLSTAQLDTLCRDLLPLGPQLAQASADWRQMVEQLHHSVAALRALCGDSELPQRRAWLPESPQGIDAVDWNAVLMDIHYALLQVDMVLRGLQDSTPELAALSARTRDLTAELDYFSHPVQAGQVRWLDASQHVTLIQSPLDIAEAMQARVLLDQDASPENRKSWIFTSATLGHDERMTWFVESCGLQGARCLQVQSPFDYARQASLYIPADMPKPNDPSHSRHVAALAAAAAEQLGGRILVLTTTLRAMRSIAEALRAHFAQSGDLTVLLQGESPKHELIARFVAAHANAARGCVLVASASFWEGVDVAGDALQMVIIDKLPFPPPDDPLVVARAEQVKAAGKSAFAHFHVPQAALALKQGAGRLIRSESDRGILVVCDVRLNEMGYGRKILAALPPMARLETHAQFVEAIDSLTKPSTTGPCFASHP